MADTPMYNAVLESVEVENPAEVLRDEDGIFEVTSPYGHVFQVTCRRGARHRLRNRLAFLKYNRSGDPQAAAPLTSHTLLWWLADDHSLSAAARRLISRSSNNVFVSAASAWEIGTKVRLGRLPSAEELTADFAGCLARERFEQLAISVEHGIRAGLLPGPYKDPFDRMLVAQSQAENLPVVSNDAIFDIYNIRIRRLW